MLPGRQTWIEKTQRVRTSNYPDAFAPLRFENLFMKPLHLCPVQFPPEMVLGMVAVIETDQIVPFVVGADPPGDRLIWISAIVKKISVQVAAAVPKVIKGGKVDPEFPI